LNRFRIPPERISAAVVVLPWLMLLLLGQGRAQTGPVSTEVLYKQAKTAQSRGDIVTAIQKYRELIRVSPKLGAAYNNLALLYIQQQQYENAVSVLQQGIKADPTIPTASALLGISLYELGKYSEARPRLEEALRRNPKDNESEKVLAKDLIRLGDLEPAAAHLQALSHRNANDQEAWYLIGEVYMQLAEQALGKMKAIDPDSEIVHEISGEIMESMKNYDGALLEYKKAAEKAPQKSGVHYKLGNVYWTIGQWDEANREFEAELTNDPYNCNAQALLADILISQKMQFEDGLTQLNKALGACPNLVLGRIDRGRTLLKLNRPQEAVEDLKSAVQLDPDDSRPHFFLSQAYRSLARTQDAASEMQIYGQLEQKAHAAAEEHARDVIQNQNKDSQQ